MKYTYPAIFEKDGDAYGLWFPDLEHGVSKGDNFEDAVEMAQELLDLILDDYQQGNIPLPEPGSVKEPLEPGQSIVNITVERER